MAEPSLVNASQLAPTVRMGVPIVRCGDDVWPLRGTPMCEFQFKKLKSLLLRRPTIVPRRSVVWEYSFRENPAVLREGGSRSCLFMVT